MTGFVTAAIISAVYFLVCAILFHFKKFTRPLKIMVFLFFLLLPLIFVIQPWVAHLGLEALVFGKPWVGATLTTIIFIFLCFVNFQLYALINTSISIQILVNMMRPQEDIVTLEDIKAVFPFDQLVTAKMEEAVRYGLFQEVQENGKKAFLNSSRGYWMGKVCYAVKKFTQWGVGG